MGLCWSPVDVSVHLYIVGGLQHSGPSAVCVCVGNESSCHSVCSEGVLVCVAASFVAQDELMESVW